jgi:hypothetical protein
MRLFNDPATATVIQHQMMTSGRNFVRNRRYVFQHTVVAFITSRLRKTTKNTAGWLKPRSSFENGPSQCRRYSLHHHAQYEHVRTWMGQRNIESKRTLHVQISCKTTTWMKKVWDQVASLKCANWIQLIWDSAHWRNFYWLNLQAPLPHAGLSVWYTGGGRKLCSVERNLRELIHTSNLTKGLSRRANINALLILKINCRSPQTNCDAQEGTRSAHRKQQKFV